ncbi:MAG: ThiF family adenylyltransferase, partial [Jatrophihabitantaceae bacterium]
RYLDRVLSFELGPLDARDGVVSTEVVATALDGAVTSTPATFTVDPAGAGVVVDSPQLAALLAAAGVGRVHVRDNGVVRLQQALPGGVAPSDEGTALPYAAARAIERAAPDADTTPLPNGERPDLVVLAYDTPVQPEHRDALHASDCAHLVVRLGPDHGVVGPLVIPGLTSCLRCADLHRLDRDPAWTALAVQLADGRPGAGSGVGVAAIVGGIAAVQALAFLDGDEPAVVDGTLELRLPDWRIRRRSWPAHPDCDCARPA